MSDEDLAARLAHAKDQFFKALARFEEALAVDRTAPLVIDGSIQRFEFTFEMAWRAMRYAALIEGGSPGSPRRSMEEAFRLGLIDDNATWTRMLDDRGDVSHTYREERAIAFYDRLPEHVLVLKAFGEKLAQFRVPAADS